MRDMIKMVVVLTVLSSFSGLLLAAVNNGTKVQIENQVLKFEKAPAIQSIFEGSSNDPVADRFKIKDGKIDRTVFVGLMKGKHLVAFETEGKGFGGELSVMIAADPSDDKIVGVRMTTNLETPGMGARAKTDLSFVKQFNGMTLKDAFKIKADNGQVDALSGATFTSRGIAMAVTDAASVYARLKPQLIEKAKAFNK